jgi:predicted alpha/beta hydrolase family esterase
MKKQVVFIGGGDSYTNYEDYIRALENAPLRNPLGGKSSRWTDSLRKDLGKDYELYMMAMPNTDNAVYAEWKIWFEKHFEYFNDGVILVGWSLGGAFLVKYLIEETPLVAVAGLFLLAAPCGSYAEPGGNDTGSFQFDPALLPAVAKKVSAITILHSEDDFVVDPEHAHLYKEMLPEAMMVLYTNKNHFLIEEFGEFVEMVKGVG